MLCSDPAHQEPHACYREAEGGWICESTYQLEKLIYAITSEPRYFRWNDGAIEWSPVLSWGRQKWSKL